MRLHHFVSGSSAILAGWLAVTFVCHVPAQRYPKHDKSSSTSVVPDQALAARASGAWEAATVQVSVSR